MEAGEVLMHKADLLQDRRSELAAAIVGLAQLDDTELKAQWQTLYGSAPPRRITRALLIGAVPTGCRSRRWAGSPQPPAAC
jgi:hypothetical protein